MQEVVHVYQNILEIRIWVVDRNALQTQIVQGIRHVLTINVEILALVFVDLMLNVGWQIMHHRVVVY